MKIPGSELDFFCVWYAGYQCKFSIMSFKIEKRRVRCAFNKIKTNARWVIILFLTLVAETILGDRKFWIFCVIYFSCVETNLIKLSSKISVLLCQFTLCVRWKNIIFCASNCGCMYVFAEIIFKASKLRKLCLTRRELSGREMYGWEFSARKCPGR